MLFTNYIILTGLFEEYGKYRFMEGMYKESRMFKQQMECKSMAADVWERAFRIINEMEGAHE